MAKPASRTTSNDLPRGLTLVLNPKARKPRLRAPGVDHLTALLGPGTTIHVTQDLDELDEVMRAWSSEDETLCFYGGDGSISRGLTSLLRHHGEDMAIPPILVVRAGTINMLASVLGHREAIDTTLRRWTGRELLATRPVSLLRVTVAEQPPLYGCVFAWGVGFRVLREYYARSPVPDYLDGLAVLSRALVLGLNPNAKYLPLFHDEDIQLSVEGATPTRSPLRNLVAGTIPRLSLGIRPYPPEPILPGGFHFSANAMELRELVRRAPTVLFQLGDQRKLRQGDRLVSGCNVRELRCRLTEGFTLDGEIYELQEPAEVTLSVGPTVRFWVM